MNNTMEKEFDTALVFMANNKYQNALEIFNKLNFNLVTDVEVKHDLLFYKAGCLFALKKYKNAIHFLKKIPEESKFFVQALFYQGSCYEHLAMNQHFNTSNAYYYKAKYCFEKIDLSVKEIQNFKDVVLKSLTLIYVKIDAAKELEILLTETHTKCYNTVFDINQKNEMGKTILMYATIYQSIECIKMLLRYGANPFLTCDFNYSAFYHALRNGDEYIAKKFIKKLGIKKLKKFPQLLFRLYSQEEKGEFSYFIASNICKNDCILKEILGFDNASACICFNAAKEFYEMLGKDGHELLFENDLI